MGDYPDAAARTRRFCQIADKLRRGDRCRHLGAAEHAGDTLDIGVLAADRHAVGNRTRHEAGILAAEEHFHEGRAGFGDDRHPIAAPEAGRDQLMGGAQRALAELAIRHGVLQQAAAVVEVHARPAAGRIVQGLPQCPERTVLLLKTDIGARRGHREAARSARIMIPDVVSTRTTTPPRPAATALFWTSVVCPKRQLGLDPKSA